MGKVFSTPEYVEKMVKDLLDNPEIRAILKGSENQIKLHKSKPTEQKLDDETAFHEMWLEDQLERYPKALKAVEPYLKAEGMILPIETWDFMRWFIKHAKNTDDYLAVKIEDYHFELYHEERLRVMNPPMPWEGLYNKLSDAGYIKTNLEVFNHVMRYKQLPGGKPKIRWLKSKVEAMYLLEYFKFSISDINDCIQSRNKVEFAAHNRPTKSPKILKLKKIIQDNPPSPDK
jgi:hypothetical protein